MDREPVTCGRHGEDRWATFVCRHLADDSAVSMLSDENVTDDDPWPDAFCERCAAVNTEHGGEWSEIALEFADVTVLCDGCYEERRAARPV